MRVFRLFAPALAVVSLTAMMAAVFVTNLKLFPNPAGASATFSPAGEINESGAFFQRLGTNGRSCASCHRIDQAMSLSSTGVQRIYRQSGGTDPLFSVTDGANCPTDDGTKAASHSLLLNRGLIRVGLSLPANREFTISVVHDPYGCAITHDTAGASIISVYRRPLPTTNLRFLSAVMFDGRDTIQTLTYSATYVANLEADLRRQAIEATLGHAQAASQPTDAQLDDSVGFELSLYTSQIFERDAGMLDHYGALGGPEALAKQQFYPGINDSLGADPAKTAFNPSSMALFSGWDSANGFDLDDSKDRSQMRARIAAGERVFNTAVATITDVRGLNDNPALGSPAVIKGTCTTCHDTPNVGNHSLPLPLDIATSRLAAFESNPDIIAGLEKLTAPDLPIYEISGCSDSRDPSVKVTFYTSDPGKALISGKCSDVNRGKGPILRGLAARAPYFHNGAAANLRQLVDFYDERFQMNLTPEQKVDLISFLNSL